MSFVLNAKNKAILSEFYIFILLVFRLKQLFGKAGKLLFSSALEMLAEPAHLELAFLGCAPSCQCCHVDSETTELQSLTIRIKWG